MYLFLHFNLYLQECRELEASTAWWDDPKIQEAQCLDPPSTSTVSSVHFYRGHALFNGIELPRRNHILILLKGKWECCAGKPRAKEQHSEGCWHNTPSVDSFNGQTPHIVNNIIFLVMITADTFPHISTWILQSCSPHPWVLRINSSGEVSGINSLLKLFLALICPNSGNWTWRGVLSREPWVHSPN